MSGMSLGMGLGFGYGLFQTQEQFVSGRAIYERALLKAFRKFELDGRTLYTCNVARLVSCDRLGSTKEVCLWRTHFFLFSSHFFEAEGVVFNQHPGLELADFSKLVVDRLYLAITPDEMIDTHTGSRLILPEPLVFASVESEGE